MKKQTVIITGASSGIGLETARYFLDRGDNVIINSQTASKLEEVFHELGAGENLAMVAGNVSEKSTGEALVKKALETFGSIDVLVNNAGIYENKPFLEVTEDYLDRFLTTNLKGTFFTTQAVIPQMIRQKDGVVINIGTPLVYHAIAESPSTAPISSKGAIHALTLQLAAEFGKDNIRVNTVAPGLIRTPMHGADLDNNAGIHLINRIGEPEEIAQMIHAIAKNKLISGAIINVDGGMGAGHHLS
ncbi:NAD(P)-dependent dehydrogenase (short-subunit alcohol dehydrogenase family) [Chryseobacterium bernardetii]|jgi:NAD(P)-dependent dehydrogenase (short-subunit alcohol dehydrogenase family)|uniref:NAD(P)-dependent dehydrogenase (Short-subunit alcohol dehydrogenase family) n=2 Tax=Chryseobacterium TaxID=59732 RepID=A0A543EKW4_9FLAO|nr:MULTISPECIES: SDR family oxidoreductase [Chryseobacterium]MDR6372182.1 NAD(P)-dependent dehydrogenase (short-subunit alcohol dehydrogenase family) [Chryseobacterium vietnamense]MDR6442435.1 NAD(P)-dependent dehydrogenase (short-subunit alcohol dehydrogenase family) [Chryseobacterium bernardetii]TQM22159.1 NAD(P)-dependent dehydrogenase (short-subunit alcohol dehydrogenase family) [Chryseobacterium aquifrigidense]